ncbi:MAG TPA: SH3 domain-containing protein [Stellaceae bacterium]|nr:SH3 domain-containing protein [Stellaceae bacterium]
MRLALGHRLAVVALAVMVAATAWGAEEKVPRFASLRADEVNLRAGPGERYPVEWVYHRKGLPVEVTAQVDVWRRVRDSDGTEGWVHQRMLAASRSIIIVKGKDGTLRRDPDASAPGVARAEAGVVARLLECKGPWCRIETGGIKGWLQRTDLWGVYPDETVE